jgi:hypothetical protein
MIQHILSNDPTCKMNVVLAGDAHVRPSLVHYASSQASKDGRISEYVLGTSSQTELESIILSLSHDVFLHDISQTTFDQLIIRKTEQGKCHHHRLFTK